MHITKETSEEIIVKTRKTKTGSLILAAGLVLTILSITLFVFNTRKYTLIYGTGTAGLILLISYIALYEQSIFRFNLKSKVIEWVRIKSFQREEGEIPFADVKDLVLQRPKVDYTYNMSKLVLITQRGEVPMTESYLRHSGNIIEIMNKLRAKLGLPE